MPARFLVLSVQLAFHIKFHYQPFARCLYPLHNAATCFGIYFGHPQGAATLIDVYNVYGNLL
jgi:hypothetical protein